MLAYAKPARGASGASLGPFSNAMATLSAIRSIRNSMASPRCCSAMLNWAGCPVHLTVTSSLRSATACGPAVRSPCAVHQPSSTLNKRKGELRMSPRTPRGRSVHVASVLHESRRACRSLSLCKIHVAESGATSGGAPLTHRSPWTKRTDSPGKPDKRLTTGMSPRGGRATTNWPRAGASTPKRTKVHSP